MDPGLHKRFLEYRDRFEAFGRGGMVRLTGPEFEQADAEYRSLAVLGELHRDDEQEARFVELGRLLFRD